MHYVGHNRRLCRAGITISATMSGVRSMDMNEKSSEPRTPATSKKPYEKPSFRFEKVFVTTALSCGKVTNGEQGCFGATKSS